GQALVVVPGADAEAVGLGGGIEALDRLGRVVAAGQVAAEQGGVRGEDCGDRLLFALDEGDGQPAHPLVEVGQDATGVPASGTLVSPCVDDGANEVASHVDKGDHAV